MPDSILERQKIRKATFLLLFGPIERTLAFEFTTSWIMKNKWCKGILRDENTELPGFVETW